MHSKWLDKHRLGYIGEVSHLESEVVIASHQIICSSYAESYGLTVIFHYALEVLQLRLRSDYGTILVSDETGVALGLYNARLDDHLFRDGSDVVVDDRERED